MHRSLALLLVLGLVPMLAGPSQAEETAVAALDWETVAAELPAPSAEHAFRFDAKVIAGGQTQVFAHFSAQPGEEGTWVIEESMRLPNGSLIGTHEMVLDARLVPLRGRSKGPAEAVDVSWRREGATFILQTTFTEATGTHEAGAVVEHTLEHDGPITASLTSLWLLARLAPTLEGSLEVGVLDPDASSGQGRIDPASLTFKAAGLFDGVSARLLEAEKQGRRFTIAFDAQTGAWLGMIKAGDGAFELRPLRSFAQTAIDAAVAFATGDVPLIDEVVHWPSIHTQMAAAGHFEAAQGELPTVEALRAESLASLEKTLPKRPAPMIRSVLNGIADQIRLEKRADGRTEAIFPAMFQGLVLVLDRVDGEVYLVEMPTDPEAEQKRGPAAPTTPSD